MRFMLTFYADTADWMSLSESERSVAIAEIGAWYGEHTRAGKILEGARLAPEVKTVRMGRVRGKERPVVSDGPLGASKESVGSYAIVEVSGEDEAIEIAKRWPAGGIVEVRRLAE